MPREDTTPVDDKRCPKCKGPVEYGVVVDAREGRRGYWCPSCELAYGSIDVDDKPPVATDGGAEPGVDISIAPNYRDGCVWVEMPGMPRKCVSPERARHIADVFEEDDRLPLDGSDGYETGTFVDQLREFADAVE